MRRTTGAVRVLLSTGLLVTAIGVVAPAAGAAESAACTWTPSILSLPAGALTGEVHAADGSGGYAGTISYGADSAKGGRAVLWKNGKMTDYGNIVDPEYQNWVSVDGVNKAGTVIGAADRQNGYSRAIHSRNGKVELLPDPPGVVKSMATGINDRGDIVGGAAIDRDGALYWYAVMWPADQPGKVVKLPGLPNLSAIATGIDQDGTVLVQVDDGLHELPYLWKGGTAHAMALPDNTRDVITRGISNGRVIGIADTRDKGWRNTLWESDGKPQLVERNADIRGINRDGQIVGRTDDPSWREEGVWQRTKLGSTLKWASDRGLELNVSSDDGTIAGRSWKIPGGKDEPTVWTCR
ncbi:hypothetical protein [Streptomyces sp. NPDC059063]|uniref:hypothetical protein n=1 Tax=unclassified Streptomyces TaxID=2593676 RepID=UPI0036962167